MHRYFQPLRFSMLVFLCVSIVLSGCGNKFETMGKGLQSSKTTGSTGGAGSTGGTGSTGGGTGGAGGGNTAESLGVCGPLPFDNVVWPMSLTFAGRRAFAVSLNITGSFEGNSSWSTIANNSDGQGLSLGLLQQNLGQGTLQPLLIRIRREHPEILKQIFTDADRTSLLGMLAAWEASAAPAIAVPTSVEDELFPRQDVLSPLDKVPEVSIDPVESDLTISSRELVPLLTTRNAASVAWAKKTLYSGSSFIPRWKTALMALANTAPYRSLQIEQAETLFDRAASYFSVLKFKEQRSFFLMYDFVVQNGGFNSSHRSQFDSYMRSNPNVSETTKAKKLTEIRVSTVSSRYKADVRSRKNTIIDSKGTVHGRKRDLPKENCYVPGEILSATTN